MSDLLRCPACGAGNPSGASWCGQCLHRFDREGRPTDPWAPDVPPAAGPERPIVRREAGGVLWTCPACEATNPIEANLCAKCGTAFSTFFAVRRGRQHREVPAGRAMLMSAGFPGLGHWAHGLAGPAIARGVLWAWTFGLSLLMLLRPPSVGRPVIRAVGVLFATAAAGVWLLSLVETRRLADGDDAPLVPPKALTTFSAVLTGVLITGLITAVLVGR